MEWWCGCNREELSSWSSLLDSLSLTDGDVKLCMPQQKLIRHYCNICIHSWWWIEAMGLTTPLWTTVFHNSLSTFPCQPTPNKVLPSCWLLERPFIRSQLCKLYHATAVLKSSMHTQSSPTLTELVCHNVKFCDHHHDTPRIYSTVCSIPKLDHLHIKCFSSWSVLTLLSVPSL